VIREGKFEQIDNVIENGRGKGMVSMNDSLVRLVKEGAIDIETAQAFSPDPAQMLKKLSKQGSF